MLTKRANKEELLATLAADEWLFRAATARGRFLHVDSENAKPSEKLIKKNKVTPPST